MNEIGPYMPVQVTRGALVSHRDTYALLRFRGSYGTLAAFWLQPCSEEAHKCPDVRPKHRVLPAMTHTVQLEHHKEGASGYT